MPIAKNSGEKFTLFFISDVCPTEEELAFADSLDGKVVFRNFNFATVVEADVGFVAGMTPNNIPVVYKDFPLAKGLEEKWTTKEKRTKQALIAKPLEVEQQKVLSVAVPPSGAAVGIG